VGQNERVIKISIAVGLGLIAALFAACFHSGWF
jgi:hypothetical protein